MKYTLSFLSLITLLNFSVSAQESKKPPLSPEAAFTQQFGGSEIEVQYARPSTRGRKIFGGLVPFDTLWRTGAGECTTFKVNQSIYFAGQKIDSGKYSLFTIPDEKEWTIILNKDYSMHGSSAYDAAKDLLRVKVNSQISQVHIETFSIEIGDFTKEGNASLNLAWEYTKVKIPLGHPDFQQNTTQETGTDTLHDTVKKSEIEDKSITAPASNKAESPSKVNAHTGHSGSSNLNASNTDIKSQFIPVLSEYYNLKDALINENSKLAAEKASALKEGISKIVPTMWIKQDQATFAALKSKILTDLTLIIKNSKSISIQRTNFITLSENTNLLVKELKINTEPAYLQYCPMANDGKGAYWLSKDNKVLNPYYGTKMLTCGSVKATYK